MQTDKPLVIITSFLRPELLNLCLDSWLHYTDFDILAIEQLQHQDLFEEVPSCNSRLSFVEAPYDIGLSYSRNFGVEYANKHGYKYVIIAADSIHLDKLIDLTNVINVMDCCVEVGIVGFDLKDRVPWEVDMEIKNRSFYLTLPKRQSLHFNNVDFQPVDMCRNFFIAKTQCLIDNPWDNQLKLAEHQDWAWRLKQTPWKVWATKSVQGIYVNDRTNTEYKRLRNRCWTQFSPIVCKKYGLDVETTYSPELQAMFNEWNKNNPKIC